MQNEDQIFLLLSFLLENGNFIRSIDLSMTSFLSLEMNRSDKETTATSNSVFLYVHAYFVCRGRR